MNRIIFIIITILTGIAVTAQTTQPGIVQEYNEKAKKTPLAGVEVRAKSANNAASGKDGKFELQFLTLKPGDKVNVSRIEKPGYDILNESAVNGWILSSNHPFEIVMCRSEKFKAIFDIYHSNGSASYKKQLNKGISDLNRLKASKKIKETEYNKMLAAQQQEYERQLDQLKNIVDRFTRIDISQLPNDELKIIESIQQGKFEEAISAYKKLNLLGKYIQEQKDTNRLSVAQEDLKGVKQGKIESISHLRQGIDREIGNLCLAGGRANINSVDSIFSVLIRQSPTDYATIIQYSSFLNNYLSDFNRSLGLLLNAAHQCEDIDYKASIFMSIADSYHYLNNNAKAIEYYNNSLNAHKLNKTETSLEAAKAYHRLGLTYMKLANDDDRSGNPNKAAIHYDEAKKAYDCALEIYWESPIFKRYMEYANLLNSYGGLYDGLKKYYEALGFYLSALDMIPSGNPTYANIVNNIGLAYYNLGLYEKAIDWFSKALETRRNMFGNYHLDVATSLGNLGSAYTAHGKYQEAFNLATEEISLRIYFLNANNTSTNYYSLSEAYLRAGDALYKNEEFLKSKEFFQKALEIRSKLYGDNDKLVQQIRNMTF